MYFSVRTRTVVRAWLIITGTIPHRVEWKGNRAKVFGQGFFQKGTVTRIDFKSHRIEVKSPGLPTENPYVYALSVERVKGDPKSEVTIGDCEVELETYCEAQDMACKSCGGKTVTKRDELPCVDCGGTGWGGMMYFIPKCIPVS